MDASLLLAGSIVEILKTRLRLIRLWLYVFFPIRVWGQTGPLVNRWIQKGTAAAAERRMGGGGQQTEPAEPGSGKTAGVYTWEEVQKHRDRNDQWLVVNRKVYNISQWVKRHPGGSRVIGHYAGEDATVHKFSSCRKRSLFSTNDVDKLLKYKWQYVNCWCFAIRKLC